MNVVWRKEWIYEYESPWSVFEKMALVNLADRNEILQIFGSAHVKNIKHYIGDKQRELLQLNGFHLERLHQTLDFNLQEHNFKSIQSLIAPFSELYSSWEHWFHRELHWCSKCMEGGYHSWLHQCKLLDECAFHDLKLNNACPTCRSTIPFLLSNRQLEHAFQCKCGNAFATFHISSWNEWRGPDQMNPAVLRWVQSNQANMKISNMHSKWIIHAQHCNLKRLVTDEPEEIKVLISEESAHRQDYFSNRFQKDLLQITSNAVQQVIDRLFQSTLKSHQHCITQLMELRKSDEAIEFPEICPYAYAYVFWRKSILKEEHFYGYNSLRTTLTSDAEPLIIRDLLEYFSDQVVNYQMKIRRSIDMGGLSWILEKLVLQFSENFFYAWMETAGKRSKEISVPSWNDIENMRDRSFPHVAFKYNFDESSSSSSIEYYHLQNREPLLTNKCNCPNQHETAKQDIQLMISYTPQKVAMLNMSNPSDEYKILQKTVERYVKKLSF
ncbi:hypothetical protein P4H27_10575 [Paenibacillus taichungensis]|uniref:hypothetical protein n=1 Tax=Paenibacillus TaxID=44249 RepID=UPI000C194E77|nr:MULTISPECIES: hypothetical protein [Paenibacillus]MEC0107381.1 hypothetical protein [Paenibacillus taichungensis]MEC0195576.1 hypothetical protein [Paenibacillus taichungensis]PIH60296.1 hypothetical protein CS562_04100 [Paenibacillus sp. LK1]